MAMSIDPLNKEEHEKFTFNRIASASSEIENDLLIVLDEISEFLTDPGVMQCLQSKNYKDATTEEFLTLKSIYNLVNSKLGVPTLEDYAKETDPEDPPMVGVAQEVLRREAEYIKTRINEKMALKSQSS